MRILSGVDNLTYLFCDLVEIGLDFLNFYVYTVTMIFCLILEMYNSHSPFRTQIGSAISTKRTFGEGSHVGRVQNIAQPLSMLLYWKYIIILPIGISAVTSTTAIVTPKT